MASEGLWSKWPKSHRKKLRRIRKTKARGLEVPESGRHLTTPNTTSRVHPWTLWTSESHSNQESVHPLEACWRSKYGLSSVATADFGKRQSRGRVWKLGNNGVDEHLEAFRPFGADHGHIHFTRRYSDVQASLDVNGRQGAGTRCAVNRLGE
ncbi:MAG: hypothetical protein M1826_003106 [Phylliscum demangeonii]|nr:MAG: hypothetical protein M1826_003106 [Phylliscum demangeonii]